MTKTITLQEALDAWGTAKVLSNPPGEHIEIGDLYEWLIHPDEMVFDEEAMEHLVNCSQCLNELKDLVEVQKEATDRKLMFWDAALPKAAASKVEWPKKFLSERGQFTIDIRRMLNHPDRGVMVVQVEESFRTSLEGQTIQVSDGAGRVLLKGQIIDGEVTQIIESGLDEIDPSFYIKVNQSGD